MSNQGILGAIGNALGMGQAGAGHILGGGGLAGPGIAPNQYAYQQQMAAYQQAMQNVGASRPEPTWDENVPKGDEREFEGTLDSEIASVHTPFQWMRLPVHSLRFLQRCIFV